MPIACSPESVTAMLSDADIVNNDLFPSLWFATFLLVLLGRFSDTWAATLCWPDVSIVASSSVADTRPKGAG